MEVPAALAPRARAAVRSLALHSSLNEANGHAHHFVAHAALDARARIGDDAFSDARRVIRRGNLARHNWADDLDDPVFFDDPWAASSMKKYDCKKVVTAAKDTDAVVPPSMSLVGQGTQTDDLDYFDAPQDSRPCAPQPACCVPWPCLPDPSGLIDTQNATIALLTGRLDECTGALLRVHELEWQCKSLKACLDHLASSLTSTVQARVHDFIKPVLADFAALQTAQNASQAASQAATLRHLGTEVAALYAENCASQSAQSAKHSADLQDFVVNKFNALNLDKATARTDAAEAKSAKLGEELQVLAGELSALKKEQAELDKIRAEEKADYEVTKSDLEAGLYVLQEYYAAAFTSMLQDEQPAKPAGHQKSSGAGGSIIDILQTVESDFATNLAKVEAEESDSQSEYEKVTQENKVTQTSKEGDQK